MLKYGICGAGIGSFISDVHIRAIEFTHGAQLVAGCFSRDAAKNISSGEARNVAAERVYKTPEEMAKTEAARSDGIDFVVVTTRNTTHYAISKAFLEAGIHVVSDKPVTTDEKEAAELKKLAEEKNLKFCVTFTYAGYPMLQHAREVITRGDIGDIVMVMGEYVQDWMADKTEMPPWRSDPAEAGRMNCISDIGSHVCFTAEFLTGLKISEVCCVLDRTGGYKTDSNASVLLKFHNGATGVYWSSQIAYGNENGIRLRIYGAKGSVEWKNEEPEDYILTLSGQPSMRISKGRQYKVPYSSSGKLPAGHSEGLYTYFSNIYASFIAALNGDAAAYYPTIDDGLSVMHWLECCYLSDEKKAWVKM